MMGIYIQYAAAIAAIFTGACFALAGFFLMASGLQLSNTHDERVSEFIRSAVFIGAAYGAFYVAALIAKNGGL